MTVRIDLGRYRNAVATCVPVRAEGRVVQVIGLTIEAQGLMSRIGELCSLYLEDGRNPITAEVVGFKGDRVMLMPFAELAGVQPGTVVRSRGRLFAVPVGPELLGRVLDGLGRPLDGLGPLGVAHQQPLLADPPPPLSRPRIVESLATGIRAIDGLLTVGKGQRMGIFAGSGVGKSTLLGMIARNSDADVNVIALIGERGREVQEFLDRDLGERGRTRSVVVVATSDTPALIRLKAAWVATGIAEFFRDRGLHVNFMMDSVTRFAMAQREIGLAVGEPPALKGYPPSVFALIPKLLERTGASERGTITGFYTVLVEGDDLNEPITDTVRSVLDGHIVLRRELAAQNHYPAIDVLGSVSRLMSTVADKAHQAAAGTVRELLAAYENARDLINIGAYVSGSNPVIDRAIAQMPDILAFLRQPFDDPAPWEETIHQLLTLAGEA
ncbi:MAG: EscN/YscN/HrcN family type III secretion system ATPase [Dehalococcoidia bacterium]|nr:MAG: EscN/YscN/HrcN family type III secretion system ATPase [Dehalococcoidia bacterium]